MMLAREECLALGAVAEVEAEAKLLLRLAAMSSHSSPSSGVACGFQEASLKSEEAVCFRRVSASALGKLT